MALDERIKISINSELGRGENRRNKTGHILITAKAE